MIQLIIGILLVGVTMGLGLGGAIEWQRGRGKSWGEIYMKEYGLDEDNKENK